MLFNGTTKKKVMLKKKSSRKSNAIFEWSNFCLVISIWYTVCFPQKLLHWKIEFVWVNASIGGNFHWLDWQQWHFYVCTECISSDRLNKIFKVQCTHRRKLSYLKNPTITEIKVMCYGTENKNWGTNTYV